MKKKRKEGENKPMKAKQVLIYPYSHTSPFLLKKRIRCTYLSGSKNGSRSIEDMSEDEFLYTPYYYGTSSSIKAPNSIYMDLKFDQEDRSHLDNPKATISSHLKSIVQHIDDESNISESVTRDGFELTRYKTINTHVKNITLTHSLLSNFRIQQLNMFLTWVKNLSLEGFS